MKNKILKYVFFAVCFAYLFIFFVMAHPLYLFDSDDWGYASFHRRAIPNLYEWNPTRIFPEIFFPLCAKIAAYIIFPVNHDFVSSLNIVSGIVLSAGIVAYLFLFYKVCSTVLKANSKTSLMITFLFLVSHFTLLDPEKVTGNYLFWAHNLSCVYYYTIPSLLNSSLVLLYLIKEHDDNAKKDYSILQMGLIISILYLSVNSNLYQSTILIVFIFTNTLYSFIKNIRNLRKWVDSNKFNIMLMIVWLVSAVLESRGPRSKATWLGVTDTISNNLTLSFSYLIKTIAGINKFYLPLFLIAIAAYTYSIIKKDWNNFIIISKLITATLIYFVFLVVVNAKVSPDYNNRIDVSFGLWFYIILIVTISVIMIIDRIKIIGILMPLIMLILTNECVGNIPKYNEYNITDMKPGNVYEIDTVLISKIEEASDNDISEITIKVPQFSNDPNSNWPLTQGVGQAISNTLYTYNIISRKVNVTIIPDQRMSEKYDVEISEKALH